MTLQEAAYAIAESLGGLFCEATIGLLHIEGMHVAVVNVNNRIHAGRAFASRDERVFVHD